MTGAINYFNNRPVSQNPFESKYRNIVTEKLAQQDNKLVGIRLTLLFGMTLYIICK